MADDHLITEELERVYRLYGEASRQFRRALYGLIVVGVGIFALVIVPFLTFRDQIARLEDREQRLTTELQQARDLLTRTRVDFKDAVEIRNELSQFADRSRSYETFEELKAQAEEHGQRLEELRNSYAHWQDKGVAAWVRGETKRPPEQVIRTSRRLSNLDGKPCYWESGVAHVACQLCDVFKDRHKSIASRISRLESVDEVVREVARDDLASVVARACGWLARGEAHWESGEPVTPEEAGALRGVFTHDLHAYEQRMDAFIRTLRERLPGRELDTERLSRELDRTKKRLVVFEGQLDRIASFDRIGTPMGDLPVGLGQIVLLFPVLMALGFVVVANGYSRIAGLRRAFVRLCRKRDQAGDVIDAEHIAVVTPLWLDPREPLYARMVRWAIMLTPLGLVAANLALVISTEALSEQLPDDAVIPPVAYWVLYAASLALLAGALWNVWRIGRRLAEHEASPAEGPNNEEPTATGRT